MTQTSTRSRGGKLFRILLRVPGSGRGIDGPSSTNRAEKSRSDPKNAWHTVGFLASASIESFDRQRLACMTARRFILSGFQQPKTLDATTSPLAETSAPRSL